MRRFALVAVATTAAVLTCNCTSDAVVGFEGCTPTTEICRDAKDNDCDGEVDEPACRPRADQSWGEYAAGLDLRACPDGTQLVVDTTEAELQGGETLSERSEAGEQLSLPEAMHIASNNGGAHTIRFDESVFPAGTPATIELGADVPLPRLEQTCVDARNRGVVLSWADVGSDCAPDCTFDVGPGSLVVGLTLLELASAVSVTRGQLAGCRVETDGRARVRGNRPGPVQMRAWSDPETVLGPGNVLTGLVNVVPAGGGPNIRGNFFGWDPLTRQGELLAPSHAVEYNLGPAEPAGTVQSNVFAGREPALFVMEFNTLAALEVRVRENRFGVGPAGEPLEGATGGMGQLGAGAFELGPDNTVRGAERIVTIGPEATVTITRNRMTENEAGIVFSGSAAVDPPMIESAAVDGARGGCPVSGTVELFADPAGQGAHYLGSTDCTGDDTWSVTFAAPEGHNLTATLTDSRGHTSAFSEPVPIP